MKIVVKFVEEESNKIMDSEAIEKHIESELKAATEVWREEIAKQKAKRKAQSVAYLQMILRSPYAKEVNNIIFVYAEAFSDADCAAIRDDAEIAGRTVIMIDQDQFKKL